MTEQDRASATQFFAKHPAGIAVRGMWDHRVQEMTKQLVYETDPVKITQLQAKIQYHKEVLQPEIGI